ncbi:hypothetical protein SNA_13995 [Streptomyces natalensis ATCC 27448]|uniref:Uncharacterized protein n=1 Tax=Streptomyces natalensis ATCC 27448 TaxID=1240678 RepID=A0A0D7CN06_9ACTN|nr:hypothetical protein SNA_13995 [Streptomyces natalensis ATCC 27448]
MAVGALGAAGSDYITGRKAEQQAQWQLCLEHLNQRREPRAQAYAAVLALANEVLGALAAAHNHPPTSVWRDDTPGDTSRGE